MKSHYVRLLSRLVPSNLVEKLTGEDLLEFHQSVVLGINEEDVWSTAVPTNLPLEGYPGAPGTTGGTGGVGGAVGAGATGAMSPEREEPSMPYHCEYKFPFVYTRPEKYHLFYPNTNTQYMYFQRGLTNTQYQYQCFDESLTIPNTNTNTLKGP